MAAAIVTAAAPGDFLEDNSLSNLVAGFALLLYRPVRVGEQIQLTTPRGVMTAKIESIMLGYTFLKDSEGNQVIVPNSMMANIVMIRIRPAEK